MRRNSIIEHCNNIDSARLPAMRPPTACTFCRSRRRRCQRSEQQEASGGPCDLCQKYNIQCSLSAATASPSGDATSVYHEESAQPASTSTYSDSHIASPTHRRISSHIDPSAFQSLDASLNESLAIALPSPMEALHFATLYFDYIHDQFHTLFHRPAFMADLTTGRIPPVILFAMTALSARFSTADSLSAIDPRVRGAPYARKSAALLDVSDVSLTSIQACVMLGAYRVIEGDAPGEAIYYGIACRMAQLLDLPYRVCESVLERELNIRVWHTLCMIDEWSSSGLDVPRQIINPPADIPLPADEMIFLQMRRDKLSQSNVLPHQSAPGLIAQMITLNRIFRDINQMNSQAVDDYSLQGDTIAVEALSLRMSEWELSLPSYMRDEPANLAFYAAQGLGRIYVAVYLGYYHFGQLLYYQFLHGAREEQNTTIVLFAERCKSFAARLCTIVYAAVDTPGCDTLYSMVGHVLVIASTVQIHTLLFSSDNTEIRAARQRLERNFSILLKLRTYWPTLDVCMMRLQTFHKACCTSMDNSFKLDRWMLRFLSEFAKPVSDKNYGDDINFTIGGIAITPSSDFGIANFANVIDAFDTPFTDPYT